MTLHCENLLMGKQQKISSLLNSQLRHESSVNSSPRQHGEENKIATFHPVTNSAFDTEVCLYGLENQSQANVLINLFVLITKNFSRLMKSLYWGRTLTWNRQEHHWEWSHQEHQWELFRHSAIQNSKTTHKPINYQPRALTTTSLKLLAVDSKPCGSLWIESATKSRLLGFKVSELHFLVSSYIEEHCLVGSLFLFHLFFIQFICFFLVWSV